MPVVGKSGDELNADGCGHVSLHLIISNGPTLLACLEDQHLLRCGDGLLTCSFPKCQLFDKMIGVATYS